MKQKVVVAFSGGKDCHYMLGQLLHDERYEVVGLTTTIVDGQFVTSHFVPRELLEAQARALNLPLFINELTQFTAEEFERRLIALMTELRDRYGVTAIAYGDLYLQDVRDYKQQLLEREGFQLLTPLWGRATDELIATMLDDGWKALTISIQSDKLPSTFLGVTLTKQLIATLPSDVDCCGENGEYHTFVYDGPLYQHAVAYRIKAVGATVRSVWHYVDLVGELHV